MREEGWDVILRALATQGNIPVNASTNVQSANVAFVPPPAQQRGIMHLFLSETSAGKEFREMLFIGFFFVATMAALSVLFIHGAGRKDGIWGR
jgi:hypothetical protein